MIVRGRITPDVRSRSNFLLYCVIRVIRRVRLKAPIGRSSRYFPSPVIAPLFCCIVPVEEFAWLLVVPGTTVCPVAPGAVLFMAELP
jgi:hypothetical protein